MTELFMKLLNMSINAGWLVLTVLLVRIISVSYTHLDVYKRQDYAHVLRDWKVRYAPQSPAEAPDERFVEACHKLDEVEYLSLIHI